jgi:thiamine biosynthesis lipoprotein
MGDRSFRAMGTDIRLIGDGLDRAQRWLAGFEACLSRFRPESELRRLNADPRSTVPASAVLRTAVRAALWAAELTDGLVDPTLGAAVIRAGYDRPFENLPSVEVLPHTPTNSTIGVCWTDVRVGEHAITRPPGTLIDLGGTAKGLAADRLATAIGGVADCGGDVRIVGTHDVHSEHATFRITNGAVATSGVDRRRWQTTDGPKHHLIDPRTHEPAHTTATTATALAPTALEAEARAKAALLTGDEGWLVHGGHLS